MQTWVIYLVSSTPGIRCKSDVFQLSIPMFYYRYLEHSFGRRINFVGLVYRRRLICVVASPKMRNDHEYTPLKETTQLVPLPGQNIVSWDSRAFHHPWIGNFDLPPLLPIKDVKFFEIFLHSH